MKLEIVQTWNQKAIKLDKSLKSSNPAIYPDTPLWGIAINGCHNPTMGFVLQEIARVINLAAPAAPAAPEPKKQFQVSTHHWPGMGYNDILLLIDKKDTGTIKAENVNASWYLKLCLYSDNWNMLPIVAHDLSTNPLFPHDFDTCDAALNTAVSILTAAGWEEI